MKIISAMSRDRVIGHGEGMPWNVPEEYDRYVETVRGNTVILGRKSWTIFGNDLQETNNIVITRQSSIDGATATASLEQALETAKQWTGDVFVAGGASIYALAIPHAAEMYLSTIKGDFKGDAYFPEFDLADWDVALEEVHQQYTFRRYVRVATA